jgi:hypothetical protein
MPSISDPERPLSIDVGRERESRIEVVQSRDWVVVVI